MSALPPGGTWPVPPRAMEPRLWDQPFDDGDFAFQVKWDGVRILTWVAGGGRIEAVTKRGRRREETYPELRALADCPAAVLDGEMVVLHDGRPSFPAILRRDRARRAAAVARLARALPAVYQVFDLLWRGRDLRSLPWEDRQAALAELLGGCARRSGGRVAIVPSYPGDRGRELFAAVRGLGWEGVVAKRRTSRYVPGKSSDDWRKVKAWRTPEEIRSHGRR